MTFSEAPSARELPPPERWLGHLLNRLAIITRERTYAELKAFDFAPRSFGVLLCLANEPGLSQSVVGHRLGLDRTTVSLLIEDLVNGGWVERTVNRADRRNFQLWLTDEGHTRLAQVVEKAQAVQHQILAALPHERRQQLIDDLGLLLAATKDG